MQIVGMFLGGVWLTVLMLTPGMAHAQPDAPAQPPSAEPKAPSPAPPDSAPTGTKEPERAYQDRVLAALTTQPGGLTADRAASTAVENSPSVALKRAELTATKARNGRTLSRYLPQLDISLSWTRANAADFDFGASGGASVGAINEGPLTVGLCPDGPGTNCVLDGGGQQVGAVSFGGFETPRNNYRLEANLVIPFSDYILNLGPARRATESDEAAAVEQTSVEERRVALEARVAYYEWLRTVAQIAVAEQAVTSTEARLADARLGLEGGTLAPADVLQIEGVVASSRIALHNARSFEALARRNLAVLMGVERDAFQIGENVIAPMQAANSLGTLQQLVAHGMQHRAEIKALGHTKKATELGIKGLTSSLYPRLDGIVNLLYANPNQQYFPPENKWNPSWFIGLSASWSLGRYADTRAQIKELDAAILMVDTQRAAIERAIELEVTAAYRDWQRGMEALALNQKDVQAAEAAYTQRVALFREGEATTTDVVEAEMQRFNATLRSIGVYIDLHIARAKLLRAAAVRDGQSVADSHPKEPGAP